MFIRYISTRYETRMLVICAMIIGRFKNMCRKLGHWFLSVDSFHTSNGFGVQKCAESIIVGLPMPPDADHVPMNHQVCLEQGAGQRNMRTEHRCQPCRGVLGLRRMTLVLWIRFILIMCLQFRSVLKQSQLVFLCCTMLIM